MGSDVHALMGITERGVDHEDQESCQEVLTSDQKLRRQPRLHLCLHCGAPPLSPALHKHAPILPHSTHLSSGCIFPEAATRIIRPTHQSGLCGLHNRKAIPTRLPTRRSARLFTNTQHGVAQARVSSGGTAAHPAPTEMCETDASCILCRGVKVGLGFWCLLAALLTPAQMRQRQRHHPALSAVPAPRPPMRIQQAPAARAHL
jgi:hypothetical protein